MGNCDAMESTEELPRFWPKFQVYHKHIMWSYPGSFRSLQFKIVCISLIKLILVFSLFSVIPTHKNKSLFLMWLRFNFNQSAIASDMNSKLLLTQASCLTVRRYQLITWEENPCVWSSIPKCYHHAVFRAWRRTRLCSMARLLTLPDALHWHTTVRWGAHHHTLVWHSGTVFISLQRMVL